MWNLETEQTEQILTHPTDALYGVYAMGLSLDGQFLVASRHDGHMVDVWHTDSREHLLSLKANGHDVKQLTFSSDGKWLGGAAYGVQVWDYQTGEEHYTVNDGEILAGFAFMPDGQHGISVDSENVYVWRVADGSIIAKHVITDDNLIDTIALSPDGKWLAIVTEWDLQLVDTNTWKTVITIDDPEPFPTALLFSADSTLLIAGCTDGTIQFWRVADGELSFQVNHPYSIETLALSPNGRTLATGSNEGTVRLWQIAD